MWGAPSLLKTDGTIGLTANPFGDLCKMFGIDHILILAYNPKSNGSSKQMVLEMKNLMKEDGDTILDMLMRILISTLRPMNR